MRIKYLYFPTILHGKMSVATLAKLMMALPILAVLACTTVKAEDLYVPDWTYKNESILQLTICPKQEDAEELARALMEDYEVSQGMWRQKVAEYKCFFNPEGFPGIFKGCTIHGFAVLKGEPREVCSVKMQSPSSNAIIYAPSHHAVTIKPKGTKI